MVLIKVITIVSIIRSGLTLYFISKYYVLYISFLFAYHLSGRRKDPIIFQHRGKSTVTFDVVKLSLTDECVGHTTPSYPKLDH